MRKESLRSYKGKNSNRTCRGCKYFPACGDPARTAPCNGKEPEMSITEGQAEELWRDLIGAFYRGRTPKGNTGILYVFGVANWLDVTEKRASEICAAWVHYGITERQGGGIVI